jgi:hypothetical protein
MRRKVVKRSVKVLVIKAVCKGIDVIELSARVRHIEAQCEGAYDKGGTQVCTRHNVSNVRVLDAAWG